MTSMTTAYIGLGMQVYEFLNKTTVGSVFKEQMIPIGFSVCCVFLRHLFSTPALLVGGCWLE